jgi:hypothetical protein
LSTANVFKRASLPEATDVHVSIDIYMSKGYYIIV